MSSRTTTSGEGDAPRDPRADTEGRLAYLEGENRRLAMTAERYRRMLDTADVGVWEIDADARTSFVNPHMCRMLGYTEAEMLGRGLFEFMDDEGRAITERNLARRREGLRESHDFRLLHKDGHAVWTHMITAPIEGADGEYAGALAFVTDITEARRQAQDRARFGERLVQTQKFESLGALAGGIAHDFNNLLQGILGEASLALAGVSDEGPESEAFRAIQRSAEEAAKLTRQMLAFAGRAPSATEPRDVGALVRDMEPLFRASLGRAGRLLIEVEANLPRADVDVGQLRQLLVNLVANAAESMRGRPGELRIHVGYAELTGDQASRLLPARTVGEGSHLYISIADQGGGIPGELVPRIFDPFVSTREHGRGLGLAAVLGIVRHHGGGIDLDTGASGSTFTVYLPCPSRRRLSDAAPVADPTQPLILVIDDEPMVQRIVQLSLERAGYRVITASSGEQALELLAGPAAEARMVLLDVSLPGMSGEQAYAKIRERTGAHVMFCSGYAPSDMVRRLIEGGGEASFMQKPYRPTALIAAVDAAMRPG